VPGWLLKLLACLVTGLATVGSAAYVGGHPQNAAAPLQPRVAASGGQLHLTPSVRSSDGQPPLTFTSVS
jgi:hypothetical protein